MARTPLLLALKKLVARHRAAHRLGLPLEACYAEAHEAAERRRVRGIEPRSVDPVRRQMLIGAGAAAGSLLVPRWARGADQPVIAIVGAGIAGLNCALTLKDAGLTSTIYEAQTRMGGRMFSNSRFWDAGQVTEWGGELIDSGHTTIRDLAARFGLPLDNLHKAQPPGSTGTYYFDGEYYPQDTSVADFQAVVEALDADLQSAPFPTLYDDFTPAAQVLDRMSLYDWIETRVPGGHTSTFGKLLDVAYATEYGAATTKQSALNLIYLLGFQPEPGGFEFFGESDEKFHVRGGNDQIPQAIASALGIGTGIIPGRTLQRLVRRPGGRYELTFGAPGGGLVVTADIVVLAIPFAVLREIDIDAAGFDELKYTAINELGKGHNGKLQLQFDTRFWRTEGPWGKSNGDSYTDAGYQQTWEVTRAQPGRPGILNIFTAADVTLGMASKKAFSTSQGNPDVVTDATVHLAQVETVFPGLSAHWNGKATESVPHRSPFFRASYSFYEKGQYTRFAGHERARQNDVYFCGEHTSIAAQGYMEGGAATGARAARSILARLGLGPRVSGLA